MSARPLTTQAWKLGVTLMLALLVGACERNVSTLPTAANTGGSLQQSGQSSSSSSSSEDTNAAAQNAQESETSDNPEDSSDVSLEHMAALPANTQLPEGRWKPGVNYTPLVPAQPTDVDPGKIEVIEVFWLGCPHCYALEPYLQRWLKTKPSYIQFVRVPVMWGPVHRAHARLYYTLMALGRKDLVEKAFDTIQEHPGNPLVANSDEETLKLQEAFAEKHGVSADDFEKAYRSFTVASDLQKAEQLTQRYQVQSVPFIVINGKYTTDVEMAGSATNLFQLIDDLAAADHSHVGHS